MAIKQKQQQKHPLRLLAMWSSHCKQIFKLRLKLFIFPF